MTDSYNEVCVKQEVLKLNSYKSKERQYTEAQLKQIIADLRSQLVVYMEKAAGLDDEKQSEINRLQEKYEELNKRNNDLEEVHANLVKDYEQKLRALETEKNNYLRESKELVEKVKELNEKYENKEKIYTQLVTEFEKIQTENKELVKKTELENKQLGEIEDAEENGQEKKSDVTESWFLRNLKQQRAITSKIQNSENEHYFFKGSAYSSQHQTFLQPKRYSNDNRKSK